MSMRSIHRRRVLLTFLIMLALFGCDRVSRHKVLTTFFDGVPSLPPPETFCEEYFVQVAESETGEAVDEGLVRQKNFHEPYAEKLCEDCHEFGASNQLVTSEDELCLMCHTDFFSEEAIYIHGPVSVRDCLACHLPHSSNHDALLVESRNKICGRCHWEDRLAAAMHTKVIVHDMNCIDCHDPHYSRAPYFLK